MATSIQTKHRGNKDAAKVPGDWLAPEDRRWIVIGVAVSVFLAIGFFVLLIALPRSSSSLDPDSGTLVIKPDYPRHLVDFALIDQAGHTVTRHDLKEKIAVVNFVFTSCSLICPYINAQMSKIQSATAGRSDVRLVSLAIDPADDTAAVLAKYAPQFHPDPTRWLFLTGEGSVMHNLVGMSFLAPDTTGQFSYMPGNFAHTQRIALVNKAGQIVNYFDGMNPGAANAVIEQIKTLEKMSQ